MSRILSTNNCRILNSTGLICGGSLKQRAERLFSVKGKKMSEIDQKLLAKINIGASSKNLKK